MNGNGTKSRLPPAGSRRVLQDTVADTIKESCVPTEFQAEAREAAAQRAAAVANASPAEAEQAAMDEYNRWASEHEHVIAKSLFSAGLSWPGLLLAEDIAALDILLQRPEIDPVCLKTTAVFSSVCREPALAIRQVIVFPA